MVTATSRPDSRRAAIRAGQRRARLQEAVLGLLFVAPATLAMLVFGLFPVLYGFYVSLQGRGTIIPEGFVGLDNYVRAVGSLAYVLALAIALIFVLVGHRLFRAVYTRMQAGQGNFYPYLIPGFIAAPATLLLIVQLFTNTLDQVGATIATLLFAGAVYVVFQRRQSADFSYVINSWAIAILLLLAIFLTLFAFVELNLSLDPILQILSQAVSYNKYIMPLPMQFIALLGAVAAGAAVYFIYHHAQQLDSDDSPRKATLLNVLRWLMVIAAILFIVYIIAGLELLRGTLTAFARVTPDKLATLTPLKAADVVRQAFTWYQVFTILLGTVLIGLALRFWMNATNHQTSLGMLRMFGIAIMFMIGGWLLIGELPAAAASGDPELYQSLLRTAAYAILTVPVQLGLGLLLAYLLFHEVTRGKSFFRIVYFMPYIAPTVATAAVFVVIFSLTRDGLANQALQLVGLPPQQWLRDNRGVFEIIAQLIGGRSTQLPSFLVGPSLPLVTAIIYSIWVFSGYNAVIFLAGLGAVPREMYEAAQVDGAGRWTNFRHITIPLISPTTFFLTILAIIGTFKAFNHIYVLRSTAARGAMDTTTVYIFNMIREGSQPRSYASTAAFILFGIILVLTLIQTRVSRDQVFYG
ncbi:MAG: sugar ABC transporter permease [Anaerolineae bacterium]|nr:sugar ABC transporter permease [Anaerolineae bacterium]